MWADHQVARLGVTSVGLAQYPPSCIIKELFFCVDPILCSTRDSTADQLHVAFSIDICT